MFAGLHAEPNRVVQCEYIVLYCGYCDICWHPAIDHILDHNGE